MISVRISVRCRVVCRGARGASCENKHIGRACTLSVDPDAGTSGGSTATLDVGLECPSRICMLPAREAFFADTPLTTSLCTADCSSDDDCADGELRSSSNPAGCKGGFACKVAETVGDFCCRRLCVCKDFIGKTPRVATPLRTSACRRRPTRPTARTSSRRAARGGRALTAVQHLSR